jgi:hypothetical protein
MAISSAGVVGSGRAERRRRWCNCFGVIFSAGAEDCEEGSRLRTDHVGFSRIEEAVDELVVIDRAITGFVGCVVIVRRRARRQEAQIVMMLSYVE